MLEFDVLFVLVLIFFIPCVISIFTLTGYAMRTGINFLILDSLIIALIYLVPLTYFAARISEIDLDKEFPRNLLALLLSLLGLIPFLSIRNLLIAYDFNKESSTILSGILLIIYFFCIYIFWFNLGKIEVTERI